MHVSTLRCSPTSGVQRNGSRRDCPQKNLNLLLLCGVLGKCICTPTASYPTAKIWPTEHRARNSAVYVIFRGFVGGQQSFPKDCLSVAVVVYVFLSWVWNLLPIHVGCSRAVIFVRCSSKVLMDVHGKVWAQTQKVEKGAWKKSQHCGNEGERFLASCEGNSERVKPGSKAP